MRRCMAIALFAFAVGAQFIRQIDLSGKTG